LRPKDLSGPLAVHFSLELFTAPPNSEMDTAQNKNDLTKTGLTNTNTNTNTNKNQRESSDSGSGSDSDSKEGKEGKEEEAQIKSGQTVMGTGPGAGAISIISDLSVGDERVGFEPEVYVPILSCVAHKRASVGLLLSHPTIYNITSIILILILILISTSTIT